MSKGLATGLFVAAIAAGFAAFWYLAPRDASFGMFESTGGANVARVVLSFGATIAGVVLGSFYRQLRHMQAKGRRKIGDIPAFLSGVFRSVDMWLALVSAPIVYALLLQSTDGMSLPGLLLVALENGFCCLFIVDAFARGRERELAEV